MSYEEYLVKVKEGIVTDLGHCPVTPLLVMLQGRWKSQIMYELCIYDSIRFGQLKKDLLPVFYAIMNWGFKYEKELYEAREDK